MKLTNAQLKRIIKEELEATMKEGFFDFLKGKKGTPPKEVQQQPPEAQQAPLSEKEKLDKRIKKLSRLLGDARDPRYHQDISPQEQDWYWETYKELEQLEKQREKLS
jgi:hypothetical protein